MIQPSTVFIAHIAHVSMPISIVGTEKQSVGIFQRGHCPHVVAYFIIELSGFPTAVAKAETYHAIDRIAGIDIFYHPVEVAADVEAVGDVSGSGYYIAETVYKL